MRFSIVSLICFLAVKFVVAQPSVALTEATYGEGMETSLAVNDNEYNGIDLVYEFNGFEVVSKIVNGVEYQYINIQGFNNVNEHGKPALPMHNEIIAVPMNAGYNYSVSRLLTEEYEDYVIHPALKPAFDYVGAPEPDFEIDAVCYNTDAFYPEQPVQVIDTLKYRVVSLLVIQVNPIQYNPVQKTIRFAKKLQVKVEFTNNPVNFIDPDNFTEHAIMQLKNYVINPKGIMNDQNKKQRSSKGINGPAKNYIVITQNNYISAADSLANWKRQLGYSVEVVSKPVWTTNDVLYEIQTRYNNWIPKPDYFVILGDQNDVPGQILNTLGDDFASDLYYACMDGSGDYMPDMARGRISVNSATQALDVVKKIVDYERQPINDPAFYNTGLNCAYFQEDTSGYAERRFAQTSEDIYGYMANNIGFTVNRAYYTESNVNPTNWNNGSYSAGEPLPSYLLKPGFAWDGDNLDINLRIDEGALYVLHRDHGFENGWGDPYYDISDINSLSNGTKLPIVFSINCLTGKFLEPECFSEAFLRHQNGGAVGVFCHAEVSMSGYNDGLALGLFDAIWATPGLIPNFTGTANVTGTITPHSSIIHMGDVANQGLLRMTETWGDGWGYEQYTYELFHYFGDPAMRLWLTNPSAITATHDVSIDCHDTTFTINSSSVPDGLATLVIDGQLIGSVLLSGGTGVISFSSIAGTTAWLTISKQDHQPYIVTIPITGGCPLARFNIDPVNSCGPNNSIEITDQSTGTITSWTWDFGVDAIPASATTQGPHTVSYSSYGMKTITVTVTGPAGQDTYSEDILIEEYCGFNMPVTGNLVLDQCDGYLYDNGGQGNYLDNSDVVTTISPVGAGQITLSFVEFSVEAGSASVCDYDYIEIFDGQDINAPSLGRFCNTTGSPGIITSTGGSITVLQHSDGYVNESGFKALFECVYFNQPPIADFEASSTSSCTGLIEFTDLSANGPDNWTWYFGDGNTSNTQNPLYQYISNGTFHVKLVVSNAYGADSLIKSAYVTVNMPSNPVVTSDWSCDPGIFSLAASGSGDLMWYDQAIGGNFVNMGPTFITPYITSTTTYYVENSVPQIVQNVGETNNLTDGGFLTYAHYLVFDSYIPFTLNSVEVNANITGNRTIELQDSTGAILESNTINISAGVSRITLDFNVPVETGLRLVCTGSPDLFRSNTNVSYPYELPGILSITHSSASSDPIGYYYYFYDWEVQELPCSSPRIPAVAEVYVPNAEIIPAGMLSICTGDTVVLEAAAADTYYWTPGGETTQLITVSTADTFYVEVTDSGCTAISQPTIVSISVNDPVAGFSIVNNDPVVEFINTSTDAFSYFWDFGDGNTSSNESPIHTYTMDGTYQVSLIALNGCGSDTIIMDVIVISTAIISSEGLELFIYPNPAKGILHLVYSSDEVLDLIRIINVYGKLIDVIQVDENKYRGDLDVAGFSSGVYFVVFETEKNRYIRKLIVN